jgi:hypothetical protein
VHAMQCRQHKQPAHQKSHGQHTRSHAFGWFSVSDE